MLTPVVYHFDGLKRLEGYLSKRGSKMKVHIKFDTGMGRLGFMKEDASILIDNLKRQDAIYVEGLMSHFSSSEKRDEYGLNQVKMFKEIIGLFKDNGVSLEVVHMANTGAIINYPEAHFDMVRIGIGLYGSSPSIELRDVLGLSQVMKVVSRIAFIKDFDVGYPLSYGRTYTTEKKTRVAYVPVGYSDGYPRALSNKAKVLVNGRRCNLIGRVCMDWLLVDITEIDSAYSGDEVILLGRGDGDTITADELAVLADTIPYEVLCNISKRIPKTYV
jgi:alanine racemase